MMGKIKSFIIFLSCLLAGVCLFNACSQFTQSGTGNVSVCLPMTSEMSGARFAAGDVNSYTIKLVDSSGAEVKSETVVEGGNHMFSELSPGDYTVAVEAHKISDNSVSLIGAGESRVVVVAGETAQASVILRYYGAAQLKVTYNGEPFKGKADISYGKFEQDVTEGSGIETAEKKDVEFLDGVHKIERLPAMPGGTEYRFTVKIKNAANGGDGNSESFAETEKTEFAVARVVSGEIVTVEIAFKDETPVPVLEANYKVEHYQQNIEDDEYTIISADTEENLTGTIDADTAAVAKTYEGFTAKEVAQEKIAADGSTVVKIYYDRNTITLTFNLDGGIGEESVSGKYGASVKIPENPTKTGYTFEGWMDAIGAIVELPKTFPAEDVAYNAKWIEKDAYSINYKLGGGENGDNPVSYKETDETIALNSATKVGYVFDGWYTDEKFTDKLTEIKAGSVGNLTLWAKWIPAADTKYAVEHYQQNIENDEYTIVSADTETLTGTTDTDTSAVAKTYVGFIAKEVAQVKIAADGSTVVKIYYDRKTITVRLNLDGGIGEESVSGKYGASVKIPENPKKEGYTFEGWMDASDAVVELPKTFPAEDAAYKAKWIEIVLPPEKPTTGTISGIEITYSKDNDIKLSASGDKDTETRTFTAESEYKTYNWYLDDSLISGADKNEYALDCSKLEAGIHSIMVLVTDSAGNVYSASSTVAVYKK